MWVYSDSGTDLDRSALGAACGQAPLAVVAGELTGPRLVPADSARFTQLQVAVEIATCGTALCGGGGPGQVTYRSARVRARSYLKHWFLLCSALRDNAAPSALLTLLIDVVSGHAYIALETPGHLAPD